MNLSEFLEQVRTACVANNVALVLSASPRVFYEGMTCNGFFESSYPLGGGTAAITTGEALPPAARAQLGPVLAAACNSKTDEELLSLLAHEYCHMQQFLEGSPLWLPTAEFQIWEQWLGGTQVAEADLERVWQGIVLLEADCERRVVELIKDWGLPLDPVLYAQRANSYLFFYTWAKEARQFYKTAPYEVPYIVEAMPTVLLEGAAYVTGPLTKKFLPLFAACA